MTTPARRGGASLARDQRPASAKGRAAAQATADVDRLTRGEEAPRVMDDVRPEGERGRREGTSRYAPRPQVYAAPRRPESATPPEGARRHVAVASPPRLSSPTPEDHSGWERVLAVRCPRHHADVGVPCWDLPRAVCRTRMGALHRPGGRRR